MKPIEILKAADLEESVQDLIRGLFKEIPEAKVRALAKEKVLDANRRISADYVATVQISGKTWSLIVEVNREGYPRNVRLAVAQLQHYLKLAPGKRKYGIVVSPYISEDSARICLEEGIGYADLSGNAQIGFGGIHIRTKGGKNSFRQKKEAKSLFSTKSRRVLQRILQGPIRDWKVSELAGAAQVSVGWVSALKQQLIAKEWARDAGGGLRIIDPGRLLDAWAQEDAWAERTEVRQYSLLVAEPAEIAKAALASIRERKIAFTQWFAGWVRAPYTVAPIVTAYVDAWPEERELEKSLTARRVSQGGRLWLVKPKDDDIFRTTQAVHGFPLVSDIQIYLDLQRAGLRGEEQALELRKREDFSGGWK